MKTPSEFHKGSEGHCCKECHREKSRAGEDRRLNERANEIIRNKVGALVRERIEAPHPSEMAEAIFAEFGGVANVAKLYKEQVMSAIANGGAGSRAVLESLKTISVQMLESSARHRSSAPDVGLDDMSNAELQQVVLENMPTEELELLLARRKGLVLEMNPESCSATDEPDEAAGDARSA